MLLLRLSRTGRSNFPSYEVTVGEKGTHPQSGKRLEVVGFYQPRGETPVFTFKKDRIEHWIKSGAAVSETLARLLDKQGFSGMDRFAPLKKKYQTLSKEAKAEKKKAAAAAAPAKKASEKVAEAPAKA